jgi:hypothetical protein
MTDPWILISSELNLHREVIQGVLHALRPDLPVLAVAPADLDSLPASSHPRLVICNDLAVVHKMQPFAWILLFPDDENLALVSIADDSRTLTGASMLELVSVIDEIWSLPMPSAPESTTYHSNE